MEHLCPVDDDGGGVCKATVKCCTKRLPKPQRQRKEATTTEAALAKTTLAVRCSCLAYFCMATGEWQQATSGTLKRTNEFESYQIRGSFALA